MMEVTAELRERFKLEWAAMIDDSFIKQVTLKQSHLCKELLVCVTKFTIWPQVLHNCHIKLVTLLFVIMNNYMKNWERELTV